MSEVFSKLGSIVVLLAIIGYLFTGNLNTEFVEIGILVAFFAGLAAIGMGVNA